MIMSTDVGKRFYLIQQPFMVKNLKNKQNTQNKALQKVGIEGPIST